MDNIIRQIYHENMSKTAESTSDIPITLEATTFSALQRINHQIDLRLILPGGPPGAKSKKIFFFLSSIPGSSSGGAWLGGAASPFNYCPIAARRCLWRTGGIGKYGQYMAGPRSKYLWRDKGGV